MSKHGSIQTSKVARREPPAAIHLCKIEVAKTMRIQITFLFHVMKPSMGKAFLLTNVSSTSKNNEYKVVISSNPSCNCPNF
jgi:hypothetical protein